MACCDYNSRIRSKFNIRKSIFIHLLYNSYILKFAKTKGGKVRGI